MKRPSLSFSTLLPVSALILSISVFCSIALLRYHAFKHAAHEGDKIYMFSGDLTFMIPSSEFTHAAFMGAAFSCEKPTIMVNAPGHFGVLMLAYLVRRKPFWFPNSIGPTIWHCVTYPIFAFPAWVFVGFGIDALLGRRRVTRKGSAASLTLSIVLLGIAAGLRFGLTLEERQEQELLSAYIAGLTLWGLLFLIPFVAWCARHLGHGVNVEA